MNLIIKGVAKTLYILLFLLFVSSGLYSQVIYQEADPTGYSGINLNDIRYEINFDKDYIDSLKNIPADKYNPARFAEPYYTSIDLNDNGYQVNSDNERSINYFNVRSKGALSLNVIFSRFKLEEGDMVFMYDPELEYVVGPLTNLNNKSFNSLAVEPIPGEELIIEYHHKTITEGELVIGQISHDYLGIFGNSDTNIKSGACNVDINCPDASDWQIEKRAVVRILAGGLYWGTGTMVNNVNQENIPYILTAAHLLSNDINAENSIFWFGYESPWCEGPSGRENKTISGSDLISTHLAIDVTLLRLSFFPPITYKPYMAGWDATGTIPEKTVTIHHPDSDVKKISMDYNQPEISSVFDFWSNGFWKILEWDIGTTEEGSSGAPLFNQDHRIIGTLTGGEARCGRSVNDYFARFDIAWSLSGNSYETLKPWLSQGDAGILQLDGRDPYAPNYLTFDTLSNYDPGFESLTEYDLPGIGYTTGFNSDSILLYAEEFTPSSSGDIIEVYLNVGDINYIFGTDSILVYVLSDNNGPSSIIASQRIGLSEVKDSFNLKVDFLFPIPVSGKFYIAYRLLYKVSAAIEQRQFAVYHGPVVPFENNTAWFYDPGGWQKFDSHPADPASRNLSIKVVLAGNSYYNVINNLPPVKEVFNVFPTLVSEKLNIESPDILAEDLNVKIYNLQGMMVFRGNFKGGENLYSLNIPSIPSGAYILVLNSGTISESFKILKIND